MAINDIKGALGKVDWTRHRQRAADLFAAGASNAQVRAQLSGPLMAEVFALILADSLSPVVDDVERKMTVKT